MVFSGRTEDEEAHRPIFCLTSAVVKIFFTIGLSNNICVAFLTFILGDLGGCLACGASLNLGGDFSFFDVFDVFDVLVILNFHID